MHPERSFSKPKEGSWRRYLQKDQAGEHSVKRGALVQGLNHLNTKTPVEVKIMRLHSNNKLMLLSKATYSTGVFNQCSNH